MCVCPSMKPGEIYKPEASRISVSGPPACHAPVEHGDFHAVENLARVDVDELAAGDDEIGIDLAQRAAHQALDFRCGERHEKISSIGAPALHARGQLTLVYPSAYF